MVISGQIINMWEEVADLGPLINDIFLGCSAPLTPLETRSVVFVGPEGDIINGGFYAGYFGNSNDFAFEGANDAVSDLKWKNYSTDGSGFSNIGTSVGTSMNIADDSFANVGSSAEAGPQSELFQPMESDFGSEHPPIPESESSFSTCYSPFSSSLSTVSDNSSVRSRDEILEEIQRECAEIERKSQSPTGRRPHHHHGSSRRRSAVDAETSSLGGNNSERKKELNRIAATKYREKKRREKDLLNTEHQQLEVRNGELRSVMRDLKAEVSYLRKLMKDMEDRSKQ